MTPRFTLAGLAPLAAAALAAACGGEQAGQPSGPPITPAQVERSAASAPNRPPVIERVWIEPGDPVAGTLVGASVRASDPEGQRLEFTYVWTAREWTLGSGPEIAVPAVVSKGDFIQVTVTASDGRATSRPATASVQLVNQPPQMVSVRLEPADEDRPGAEVRSEVDAQDPDGDRLDFGYAWFVNGRRARADGPALSTARLRRDDEVHVEVVARDGESTSLAMKSEVVRIGNSPPEILSSVPPPGRDGVFRYAVDARDPDGDDNLRYRLLKGPRGMRIDEILGEVTWEPSYEQAGTHSVQLAVEDPHGGSTVQDFVLTVSVTEQPSGSSRPLAKSSP